MVRLNIKLYNFYFRKIEYELNLDWIKGGKIATLP